MSVALREDGSVDRLAARARHPASITLEGGIYVAASAVLLEESV